jgi:hypothetical protein
LKATRSRVLVDEVSWFAGTPDTIEDFLRRHPRENFELFFRLTLTRHAFQVGRRKHQGEYPSGLVGIGDITDFRSVTQVPSLICEIAPGRYQLIWILERLCRPEDISKEAVLRVKNFSSVMGAGVFDTYFRVPFSFNRGESEPHRVRMLHYDLRPVP